MGGNNLADVQRLTIVADPSNANGSTFGGIRAGNAVFGGSSGVVGVSAANVAVQDVVTIGDIAATGAATPALSFGSNSQFGAVTIAGGDLLNSKTINNAGYKYDVALAAGTTSGGATLEAQNTYAQLVFTQTPASVAAAMPNPAAPTFTLSADAASVNEGGSTVFTLVTTGVATGTQYNYSLAGVNAADVTGGALAGTITIGADGRAIIPVTLSSDTTTEGAEVLTLSVASVAASVTVNDTSLTPAVVAQTYALTVGANTFTGTSLGDTFDATTSNSLNNGDVLNGGDGVDTLIASLANSTATVSSNSIERFNLTVTAGAATLNMADAAGVTSIANQGSAGNLTLTNLAAIPTLNVNTNGSDTTLNFSNAALAGAADALQVNLDGATANSSVTLTRAAGATNTLETVTVNSGSVANTLGTLSTTGAGAVRVNITGNQNLAITNALNAEVLTVDASAATGSLTLTTGGGGVTVTGAAGINNITGGAGADNITGGVGADVLSGGNGNDTISGGAGNDQITGGAGVDVLTGGEGDDAFLFAASTDLIAVTPNADAVIDSIDGGAGANRVSVADAISIGAQGADSLARIVGVQTLTQTAGAGSTIVLATDAALSDFRTINLSTATTANTVTLTGVTVGVSITGSNTAGSNDVLTGGAGADTLTGGVGQNTLVGGAGNDRITLGADAENVDGGADDDTIVGGANVTDADTIVGGAGVDTLTLAGVTALTANNLISGIETMTLGSRGVRTVTGETGFTYAIVVDNNNDVDAAVVTDTLTVNGSALLLDVNTTDANNQSETLDFNASTVTLFRVNVTGGAANDTLVGGTLADTLVGGAGNDSLTGGTGVDNMDGGEGSDTYLFTTSAELSAADTINDSGTTGTDVISVINNANVLDAAFLNVRGVETFTATNGNANSFTLGANAQAAGIVTVNLAAGNTLAAGAYTVGLTVAGAAGNEVITTGSGNDTITVAAGNDNVDAGAGDDTIVGGPNVDGNDTLAGGSGTDTLTLNAGATQGALGAQSGSSFAYLPTFNANFTGFERITLAAGPDPVNNATGNDRAGAVNQYDITLGHAANVAAGTTITIDGSALRAGVITDLGAAQEADGTRVIGGAQADGTLDELLTVTATAIAGSVSVLGGAASDTVSGSNQADFISGGAGADQLTGNGGADTILGGDGIDVITGGAGADSLDGGAGDDTFVMTVNELNNDNDTVVGGAGSNTLRVTTDANVTLADVAFNGRFTDIATVSLQGTVTQNNAVERFTWTLGASSNAASVRTVTIGADADAVIDASGYASAVTLNGGDGADTLTGSALADSISGGAGADSITSGAGNDSISGGAGANIINAGAGDDTITLGADVETVDAGTGNDTVIGGANVTANDVLTGNTGTDVLTLNAGAVQGNAQGGNGTNSTAYSGNALTFTGNFTGFEQITLQAGAASVDNATGADRAGAVNTYVIVLNDATNVAVGATITVDASALRSGVITQLGGDSAIGGSDANADTTASETLNLTATAIAGSVSVIGGAGADTVSGSAQADFISGGAGNDQLTGNGGADTILGGDGNDVITGGGGIDILTGDAGSDTFVFSAVSDSTGAAVDSITDFVTTVDNIRVTLPTADANVDVSGFASVASFNDGLVSLSLARGDSFYSSADGKLYIDVDGNGTISQGVDYVVSTATVAAADLNYVISAAVGGGANAAGRALTGGAGADTITGGTLNDTIVGGAGNDSIAGGAGNDALTGGAGVDTFNVTLDTDTISDLGTGGADVLIVANGATATATVTANWTATAATSNSGTATLTLDNAVTAVNLSAATGANGFTVNAGTGGDAITGSANNDTIFGGAGADSIVGGLGADDLTGGNGVDTFVLTSTAATDIVRDMTLGQGGDVLQVDVSDLGLAGSDVFVGALAAVNANGSQEIVVLTDAGHASDADAATAIAGQITADDLDMVVVYFNTNTNKVHVIHITNSNTGAGVTHIATLDNVGNLAGIQAAVAGNFGGRP